MQHCAQEFTPSTVQGYMRAGAIFSLGSPVINPQCKLGHLYWSLATSRTPVANELSEWQRIAIPGQLSQELTPSKLADIQSILFGVTTKKTLTLRGYFLVVAENESTEAKPTKRSSLIALNAIKRRPKANHKIIIMVSDAIQQSANIIDASTYAGFSRQAYYYYLNNE